MSRRLAVTLLLLVVACGGDKDPTTPAMPETKPVATVTVEAPSTAPLTVPATEQLEATLRAADGTVLTGRSLSWSTSDETVAAVDASGLVTAVARGSATITATSEGQSGAVTLTVFPAVPPDPDPELGLEATDITVGVELPGGAGIDASQLVVWSALGHETPVAPTPFAIPAFEGGPQLAIVLDPDGHPVQDVGENPEHAGATASIPLTAGENHVLIRVVGGVYASGGFFLRVDPPGGVGEEATRTPPRSGSSARPPAGAARTRPGGR